MRYGAILILVALAASMLSACGEQEKVVIYKQGKYQGKADSSPWDNPTFGGDKAKWDNAIRTRNQGQNEYRRFTG